MLAFRGTFAFFRGVPPTSQSTHFHSLLDIRDYHMLLVIPDLTEDAHSDLVHAVDFATSKLDLFALFKHHFGLIFQIIYVLARR